MTTRKMFEGQLIEEWRGWKIYMCVDFLFRFVKGNVVLTGVSVRGLKYRITEMENRKPYTREQKRNHKGVYMK